MCMIVGDRVVIGLQALVLNDKHFARVSYTTLFFLSVCAANGQSPVNRKLSNWLRGTLQDRVAFKALAEGFRLEQVNAAYGSQGCPCCDFVDDKNRNGDRFQCLHCGHEDASDRVAAMNYAKRLDDREIQRYTPYREVKSILLNRFRRRLEMGQPITVPGRTLETVIKGRPPLYRDVISQPGEKNLTNRTVNQRAKQKNTF